MKTDKIEGVFQSIKKIKFHIWGILLIMAVGIFLRSYNFHDWLEFSPDQARDATVIRDAVSGKANLPLLGPIAGGTNFQLGPVFYYFGYISASIFGVRPETMAYPDFLFSVLSIPLLLIFLKKYFNPNISLALTGLYSVSLFAIQCSRFSSNPNSIPFFIMLFLYSLLQIIQSDKAKIWWPVLIGVSIGIGVQLHSLLIPLMPLIFIIISAYLFWKKRLVWKNVLITILVALILNIPQFISEIQTRGGNINNFFAASSAQTSSGRSFINEVGVIFSCETIFNAHLITSFENKDNCDNILIHDEKTINDLRDAPGNFKDGDFFVLSIVLSLIFTIGGWVLWIWNLVKEKDQSKKRFLGLLLMFYAVCFIIFIPVASRLTLRYFIIFMPIPFILGGFWAKYLTEKYQKRIYVVIGIFVLLVFFNLFVVFQAAKPFVELRATNGAHSILGEIEPVAKYIIKRSEPGKPAYLTGERIYGERLSSSLEYLAQGSNVGLYMPFDWEPLDSQIPLFYLGKNSQKKYYPGEKKEERIIKDVQSFGTIRIFDLEH